MGQGESSAGVAASVLHNEHCLPLPKQPASRLLSLHIGSGCTLHVLVAIAALLTLHACCASMQSWLNSQLELRDRKGTRLDADFTPVGQYSNGGTMQERRSVCSPPC